MRVDVYSEELAGRVELVTKEADGKTFVGVRFYLELPVTLGAVEVSGPFLPWSGGDDSAAVTFWGARETEAALAEGLALLRQAQPGATSSGDGEMPTRRDNLGTPTAERAARDAAVILSLREQVRSLTENVWFFFERGGRAQRLRKQVRSLRKLVGVLKEEIIKKSVGSRRGCVICGGATGPLHDLDPTILPGSDRI
jgi:hypothetical protein